MFPDARLVPLARVIGSEASGFEIRDVESLLEHYIMTPRAWSRGLEKRNIDAIKRVGERSYRVWRLYMSAGAYSFRNTGINIVQTLLSKPTPGGRAGIPLTRDDLYDSNHARGIG